MKTRKRFGYASAILCVFVVLMIVISGFALGVHRRPEPPSEEEPNPEVLDFEMELVLGETLVLTHTPCEWMVKIIVINLDDGTLKDIVITTTLPAEIECLGYDVDKGIFEIEKNGKGKSGSSEITWTIDNLYVKEDVSLVLVLQTVKNPAGKQEFTSPGEYMIIQGASLKCRGGITDSIEPLRVWAVDELEEPEVPELPEKPEVPELPEVPREPEEPEVPEKPEVPEDPEESIFEDLPLKIDILFLLDSTGSMGDEIRVVKDKIEEIIEKVQDGTPKPIVRYAIVTYRDRRDQYITKTLDFTTNMVVLKKFLLDIVASGGGDGPESVNEALHVAINNCSWGTEDHAKLVFLIGDAPPHMDYEDDYDYRHEVKIAKQKGIKIHVIGCSGITSYPNGEPIFKEIAEKTHGTYQQLIYSSGGRYRGGSSEPFIKTGYTSPHHKICNSTVSPKIEVKDHPEEVTFKLTTRDTSSWSMIVDSDDSDGDGLYDLATDSITVKNSNTHNNFLDVQLTYMIQQEAKSNGVTYLNEVSLPGT